MEEHDTLKHAPDPRIIPHAKMVKNKNFKPETNKWTAMILKYLQYCCLVESTLSFWGFAHQGLNSQTFFEIFLGALVCQTNCMATVHKAWSQKFFEILQKKPSDIRVSVNIYGKSYYRS